MIQSNNMHTREFSTIRPSSEVEEAAFHQAVALSKGLFAHQVEGIAFLLARRRAILAADAKGKWLVYHPVTYQENHDPSMIWLQDKTQLEVRFGKGSGMPTNFTYTKIVIMTVSSTSDGFLIEL